MPQKDSLRLPQEPSQEQAVEDRPVGGIGFGGAELSQTAQVPENQESEDPERDQLVIRDGQEEQDPAREGRNQQRLADDDYNMDENEAESETDKQAALAGNDKDLNGSDGGVGTPFSSPLWSFTLPN